MSYVADKVILITGAGSGIGRELARNLSRRGARIAAVDLTAEPLAALEQELAGKPFAWAVADVTDRPGLLAAVADLERRLGPTDVLIANAGIGRMTGAFDFKAELVEAQVRVNLIGPANSVEAVLPGMIARKSGHLVVIASVAAYRGLPKLGGYCASKAGVVALFDALRFELRPSGVAVTTICPGWINTPLTKDLPGEHFFMMPVADAVEMMVGGIEKRAAWVAFPSRTVRRLRWLRWLPCGVSDWLLGTMLPPPMTHPGSGPS